MNELNQENLEWLLMVAIDSKEECETIIEKQRSFYKRSIDGLVESSRYKRRMIELNNANMCIAVISEQILKLKNVTI